MSVMPRATLIGGHGFVGRHLNLHLRNNGWVCDVIQRENKVIPRRHVGHVFYCAGLTADFRERPFDTVEAHINYLAQWLRHGEFDSLTYLSSTRVYANATSTSEDANLVVNPSVAGDLYNLSKLMGESLCLQSRRSVRIVRLSNVYGTQMPDQNFLADVLNAAAGRNLVRFRTSPDSEKDYISVRDVVAALPQIALDTSNGIFNLASGQNVSNQMIADYLAEVGVVCEFQLAAPSVKFPRIDTQKFASKFGTCAYDLVHDLPSLFQHYSETI